MHKTEILNGIFKFSNGKRTKIIRRKKVERKSNESEDTKKISRNVFTIPWNWEGKKRDGGVQLSHYNAKPPFRVESTRGKGSDTPATWLKVSKGGCSFLQSLQIAKDICQIHPADGANKQRWREKEGGEEEEGGFSAAAFEVRFNSLGSKTVEMNLRGRGGGGGGGEYFLNECTADVHFCKYS